MSISRIMIACVLAACLQAVAYGSGDSLSSQIGIDAVGLRGPNNEELNGAGVKIGQVESRRPADPDEDDLLTYSTVDPAQVWVQQQNPSEDAAVADHPTRVAGIMISSHTTRPGVAPEALLYADAFFDESNSEVEKLKAIQHVLTASGGDIRAVNNSFLFEASADGNSQLTLGFDWMAAQYHSLLIAAGTQNAEPDRNAPSDNFNGLTVGASTRVGNGRYRQAASLNTYDHDAPGSRTSIDLLAPGENITTTGFMDIPSNDTNDDGTSFAAPHVTGTVALLQQYANLKIAEPGSTWDDDAHRHEVMKAVLLNSADRMFRANGSRFTVQSQDASGNYDWNDSTAYHQSDTSLDVELGAGHLNARRALTQFKLGSFENGLDVPKRGWDFGETGGTSTVLRYPLANEVEENQLVSATLAWDRRVLKFGPLDDFYSDGDLFLDGGINDLDLYLMPEGWDSFDDAVSVSNTFEDNVELIFEPVPFTGNYEIVVHHFGGIGDDQTFGLAWWAGDVIPGDFDDDDDVDGDDLSEWESNFGPGGGADADLDGDSDGNDFLVWQQNVGTVAAVAANAPIPEPPAWLLAAVGLPVLLKRRVG